MMEGPWEKKKKKIIHFFFFFFIHLPKHFLPASRTEGYLGR